MRRERNPRNLIVVGTVFVGLGVVQALSTSSDAVGYGIASGGLLVSAVGAWLWRIRPRTERAPSA